MEIGLYTDLTVTAVGLYSISYTRPVELLRYAPFTRCSYIARVGYSTIRSICYRIQNSFVK